MVGNISIKDIKHLIYCPNQIKYELKNKRNSRKITSVLSNLIPFDFGIEFELFGCIPKSLIKCYDQNIISCSSYSDRAIVSGINLMSFRQDYCEYSDFSESNGKLNEIRARFNSFRDLDKLNRFLVLLSKYCKIPEERGGIHIHIDVSSWIDKTSNNKLKEYLNNNEVQSYILNLANGYSGKYNKRGVGYHTKGYYINISNRNSIEFRIFRLTFSYKEILRILLGLQKLVKKAKFICNGTSHEYISTMNVYDTVYPDEVIPMPNLITNSSNYNTWTMLSS